jgi:hypothetical protein
VEHTGCGVKIMCVHGDSKSIDHVSHRHHLRSKDAVLMQTILIFDQVR